MLHAGPRRATFVPIYSNVFQLSAAALQLVAFHSSTAHPPPTLPLHHLHHLHHHPRFFFFSFSFFTSTFGRQVYILVFKAALFSVKCCVATSNGLADRAFLGFQRGRRIIGGRPQRIWQMCDEFLLSAGLFFLLLLLSFFFRPLSEFCECVCVCSRGKHKSFLCCPPTAPPTPLEAACRGERLARRPRLG